MEYQMYDEDLSLFNGDLLDSFQLFEGLIDQVNYDHLKTDNLKLVDSAEHFIPSKDDIDILESNLGSLGPDQGEDVTSWMEDKVNLLDILIDNELAPLSDEEITAAMSTFVDVSSKLSPDSGVDALDTALFSTTDVQLVHTPDGGVDALDTALFSTTDVQLVDAPDTSMHVSFTSSNDSGVEFSIEETGQDLLELLPQQLLENIEDPSSQSLLLGNVDNAVVDVEEMIASPLPVYLDIEDASELVTMVTESTSLSDLSALGVHEVQPTISLSPISSDMCFSTVPSTSDVSLVVPPVSSPPSTIDLTEYFSLPSTTTSPEQSLWSSPSGRESPDSSMSSSVCSSPGRNSPYSREDFINTPQRMSSRGLKPGDVRVQDKKLRKMRQNKDAATRYRIKKKVEGSVMSGEIETLQKRNDELHDQVDTMSREIAYLKELFADVYQTKIAMKASKPTT